MLRPVSNPTWFHLCHLGRAGQLAENSGAKSAVAVPARLPSAGFGPLRSGAERFRAGDRLGRATSGRAVTGYCPPVRFLSHHSRYRVQALAETIPKTVRAGGSVSGCTLAPL